MRKVTGIKHHHIVMDTINMLPTMINASGYA
jgi:hypothetical protein